MEAAMNTNNLLANCGLQKQQEMEDKAIKIAQAEGDADDDAGKQPPRTVTRNIKGGQMREYIFLKSVKSVEELNKFRFKNCCSMNGRKPLPTFKFHTLPCERKIRYRYQPGEQCDFELLALRQESGSIHVYAHGEHNHPIMPEERRASIRGEKELMPAENPPRIFHTPDNAEWTFLRTFADFDQMQQFRWQSQCTFRGKENRQRQRQRIRLPCYFKWSHNCQFKLLTLKNTSAGYHVYKIGEHEHNHPAIQPKKKQQPAEVEVDEEEEDEDHEDGQKEDEVEEDENEGVEDDDIIVIEDEDSIIEIEVERQQKLKREGSMEKITETPWENDATPREAETPREETLDKLEKRLQTATAKVYAWMAGIEPTQIGPTLEAWDNSYLLKMVEVADQEIRENPAKLDLWRPFLKVAIEKCMSQMEDFSAKYKDLLVLMVDHD